MDPVQQSPSAVTWVHKSQPRDGWAAPDLLLEATKLCPDSHRAGDFEVEAAIVFNALVDSLPAGTIDRVTIKLLTYQASTLQTALP